MTFFVADNHFNHANIIMYCKRPFASVSHMNRVMIDRWNSVVYQTDTVYHLGDLGFGSREVITNLLNGLNGNIILIKGNHDKLPKGFWERNGVDFHKHPIPYRDFILSHEPIEDVRFNVHGHTHNNPDTPTDRGHLCISVENINYIPLREDELIERIEERRKDV